MIRINKLEDIRDQVLKLSLAGVENTKRGSELLGIPKSSIWQAAKRINEDKDWYIFTQTFGGDIFSLKVDKEDVQYFLDSGGYSKEVFKAKVTDAERLEILQDMFEKNGLSIAQEAWDIQYSRIKAILKNMIAMDLIDDKTSDKSFQNFTLTKKGILAINNGTTILNNQINIDMSRKNKFEGPTIYTERDNNGEINQDNSKKND